MDSRRAAFTLAIAVSAALPGCSHFYEDRAITAFTEAIRAGQLEELRAATSADFEQKALRRTEALDDLRILRLPEEPPAIVEVRDISDSEKQVTVTDGDGTSRLLYKLVRDGDGGEWVVDDVYTRQQSAGVKVAKPVTEQMDLLLTIRDFLDVWDSADRAAILDITTARFRSDLAQLPAPWLGVLTRQVVHEAQRPDRTHTPQVSIDGETADVRLAGSSGTLKLSMKLEQSAWKIDDAAVDARREEQAIRSVRNRARVIAAATQFVEAFRKADKSALQQVSTDGLFGSVLQQADLVSVTLPDITMATEKYELKATNDLATLVCPTDSGLMKLELRRLAEDVADGAVQYRVSDVTLYGADKSNVRLSSMFTATRTVRGFNSALQRSDLSELQSLASPDFLARVWRHAAGIPLQLLPAGPANSNLRKVQAPQYHGSMTRVPVTYDDGDVVYVLREVDGQWLVDDMLLAGDKSLKQRMELTVPVLAFAGAYQSRQIPDLQRTSSSHFSRLVWELAGTVPEIGVPVMSYLTAPVRQISVQPGRAIIQLGDVANGAQVQLVKEHQHWVVDDIEIVSSADAAATVQLKQALRSQVVFNNTRSLSPRNVVADERPSVVRRPGDTRPSVGGRFDLRRTEQADPEVRNLGIAAATTPASPVLQDPEIDHAALFGSQHAAAEVVHADASSFAEPARVRPEADAMQLPSADELPVDMDELFGDLDRDPESMITQAEPQPVRSSVPAPQQVVSAVPINDTGRVVDPALQPIRIPR